MNNLRTSSTDAASLFAAWPQTVEIVDRVTRPEARRLDEFLFPSGRDRHRTAWTEDDDALAQALAPVLTETAGAVTAANRFGALTGRAAKLPNTRGGRVW